MSLTGVPVAAVLALVLAGLPSNAGEKDPAQPSGTKAAAPATEKNPATAPAKASPAVPASGPASVPAAEAASAPAGAAASAPDAAASAPAAGMRAFIDPATGQLVGPDAEDVRNLMNSGPNAAALRTFAAPAPRIIRGPGSTIGMALGDEFMMSVVAHKDASGKVTFECLPGGAPEQLGNPPAPKKEADDVR
jgi:hypothetical protein